MTNEVMEKSNRLLSDEAFNIKEDRFECHMYLSSFK